MRKVPDVRKDSEIEIGKGFAEPVGPGVRKQRIMLRQRMKVGTSMGASRGASPFIILMRPAWEAR